MTDRLYKRTLLKESVPSSALGKTRDVTVYLPPGYNELSRYPVFYGQDGLELINFGRAATIANRLILDEGAEPFVIVGIHVDLPNRSAEYAPGGARFDAYMEFFAEEMLPYIEYRYPVKAHADHRVLVGDSLGGTVSLHLALSYPHLFRNVISLSGAFFEPTRRAIRESPDLSWLRMYQLIGTEETDVQTEWGVPDFLEANRLTRELLEQKNAGILYKEGAGKHTWGFWQNELADAMRYFIR